MPNSGVGKSKPIFFRAVHTKTRWRKARHETLTNARSLGTRSARALFRGENDAIDLGKHGQPLYVVIWADGATSGEVLKPDALSDHGFRAETVTQEAIRRWESSGGASDDELEAYFDIGSHIEEAAPQVREHEAPSAMPESVEALEALLQAAVSASRALSQAARRKRLESASPVPRQIQVQATAFVRNADVIVEVLERARGQCESCQDAAPFLRMSDGSPYLEVHHIVPLARGGHDTVANAQALCPTCHRRIHFGNHAT